MAFTLLALGLALFVSGGGYFFWLAYQRYSILGVLCIVPPVAVWLGLRHWEQARFAWLTQFIGVVSCCCGLTVIKHEQPDTWQHWSERTYATVFQVVVQLRQLPVKEQYLALLAQFEKKPTEEPLTGLLAGEPFNPSQVIYTNEQLVFNQLGKDNDLPEMSLSIHLPEKHWHLLHHQGELSLVDAPFAVSWYSNTRDDAAWEEQVGIKRFKLIRLYNRQLAFDLQLDDTSQLFGYAEYR
ncbi:hypothetical protein H0A36_10625 [Endozoicomonas sp. SM1973]|uniref:Uncharacterized protein n=1 Tax=Spartinivicinus marinus TaxID=2994442 RepID=A0A853I8Q4_9GAMM|nr:hypothetical protein [Spartinivicinus marinus]MCX4024890.1 hypothetical protein [Spartinivicinus marinus]NYZ66464.1 hypothetical protein [Spartinivicinus marinus]